MIMHEAILYTGIQLHSKLFHCGIGRQEVLLITVKKQKNIPLFHSEIGFTFGWVFIREGKLFICRVRKMKITRPVCFVKQNKLFFVYDFFYWTQTKHFVEFLMMMPWLFFRKKCRRITQIKSVSQPRRLASRRGS